MAPLIVTLLGRVVKARSSGTNGVGVDGSTRADLLAAAIGQALFAALAVSGGAENLLQATVPTAPRDRRPGEEGHNYVARSASYVSQTTAGTVPVAGGKVV